MVTIAVSSPCLEATLPEIASTGTMAPVCGSIRLRLRRQCRAWPA